MTSLVPKIVHLQKPQKPEVFLGFLESKAVQDSLGMVRKTGKRHLKSSKTFKNKIKTQQLFE